MRQREERYRARLWYARACLIVLVLLVGAELHRYATAPAGAKDCTVQEQRLPATDLPPLLPAYPDVIAQRGGTVNDASCLSRVPVYGVARPTSETEVREALAFARRKGLPVIASGTRHGLGGQASYPGGLVLDMRGLDNVRLTERDTVQVGGGAIWKSVLEELHAHGRAVAAMPSIDILSVGGTVSVNAHGADFRRGSLASSIRSIRLMTADGAVEVLRPGDELFRAVVGGYGLFGVVLEVELETLPNEMYVAREQVVATKDLAATYQQVASDPTSRLMYAHLSTSPGTLLEEAIVYTNHATATTETIPPLEDTQSSKFARLTLNLARHGDVWQRLKWAGQRHLLPRFRPCAESRNEAMRKAEACLVSRTQAMYNGLGILRHRLPQYTDVLQEYFLAPHQLAPFLTEARQELESHEARLLSASVRVVHANDVVLDYARGDRLSVVLYLSQRVDGAGNADMKDLTERLVERALAHDGTFYLPYQLHYTRAQVREAYPMLDEFFALKRKHDPGQIFRNSLFERFS